MKVRLSAVKLVPKSRTFDWGSKKTHFLQPYDFEIAV